MIEKASLASHCVYCSARLLSGATSCGACRMPVATDSARIADGVRCPRCKARNISAGVLTRRKVTNDASVLECASCGGAFVEPHAWSEILEAVLANDPRTQSLSMSSRGELPVGELLNLLQCPGCNRELDRLAFAGRSNISIDVCVAHGAWFDAGELAKVLAVARYKNDHAGALPSDDDEARNSTAEERRAKVLNSMGIGESDLRAHVPQFKSTAGFDANRLAGRVAMVAGGLEGAAAYEVLRAVAKGSGAAFGWAVRQGSDEGPSLPEPSVPIVRQARFGVELPPLRCLFCGAIHKESDTACVVCHSPISRVVCPACHSLIAAGEEACRCGAPLMSHAADDQMACPRCKSALDRISLDENSVAHRCRRCLGSFFDIHDWSALIDRTVAGVPLPLANFDAVPAGRELPKSLLVEGAACSRCRRPMERITFAARSHVVVDICASHGMWLDAGELLALCTFMKAGAR